MEACRSRASSRRSLPATEEVAAITTQTGDRAVVLGASMAGLLAARVLADAYAQVTVIDRDPLPEASTHRRGVPTGAMSTR
jgi:NADPH-dependent 2,4-dienoyl-CoA reductase/sulfur reductase-like enzyme